MHASKAPVFCAIVLVLAPYPVAGQVALQGTYDRIELAQEFVRAVYPELKSWDGRITVQTDEFRGGPWTNRLYIQFDPCYTGSGRTQSGGAPGGARICGDPFAPQEGTFLTLTMQPTFAWPLIWTVSISGDFVGGPRERQLKRWKEKGVDTEEKMEASLPSTDVKFGPQRRQQFIQQVPFGALKTFTGCELDANSARFDIRTLYWGLQGVHPKGPTSTAPEDIPCSAVFEAVQGRFIGIDQL